VEGEGEREERKIITHPHDDSRLRGHLVGHVDVHVDLGGVGPEVVHLLQLGRERYLHLRRGG